MSPNSSLHCTHTDSSTLKNVFVFHTSCLCPLNFLSVLSFFTHLKYLESESVSCSIRSNSLRPHGLYSPLSSSVHGIFQARMLEWIAIHSLLQGIFLTQRLKPGLLHCRQILYHLSHQGSPSPQYLQFSSVAQSCLTLCDPMNHSTPDLPVHHQLLESTQTHVHRVGDAILPSHPLLSPSPPAPNPSQHQGLFQ